MTALGRDQDSTFFGFIQTSDGEWLAIDDNGTPVPIEDAEEWALEVAAERAELEAMRHRQLGLPVVDVEPLAVYDREPRDSDLC
ncbi:hypothetical protein ACWEOI_13560 [Nocardia sp. NPDC004340]|uniref:hypothetical protein n=1 Tax=Nocardia sp. CA-136227 TaxID=3239979 RepID=UPI003D992834